MQVKLCGFTDENSVKAAIAQKCDFLGFIFHKDSRRFITPKNAAIISKIIPANIAKVAVVVDAEISFLEEIANDFFPDFFQFHGNETIDFLKKIRQKFPKIKIIKAFRISDRKDLDQIKNFENFADLFLLDGKNPGSGKKFNWEILQDFSFNKDWFLSGGLNINNIEEALKITGAKLIDISSGIEEIPGQKSPKLIQEFMEKIRNLCW